MENEKSGIKLPPSTNLATCHKDIQALTTKLHQTENELSQTKQLVSMLKEQAQVKDTEFTLMKRAVKATLIDSEKVVLQMKKQVEDLKKQNSKKEKHYQEVVISLQKKFKESIGGWENDSKSLELLRDENQISLQNLRIEYKLKVES